MDKTCKRCGRKLDVSEFYKHSQMKDGYLNICMDCVKNRMKEYRTRNIDTIREKDRIRGRRTEAVKKRREYANNIKTENPEKYSQIMADYTRKYRRKFPEKNMAHLRVSRALQSGVLKRPNICSRCGKKCKPDAHHEDYTKPLDVIWLCGDCHAEKHRIQISDSIIEQDYLEK